jgi:hypothetical protein
VFIRGTRTSKCSEAIGLPEKTSEEFADFVNKYLIVNDAKCNRHCQSPAKFTAFQSDRPGVLGGYVCPQNYVSRVVYFSLDPDPVWFEKFLKDQAGDLVRSRDIRVATRHGPELGGNAETEIKKISQEGVKQLYWTLYPASDAEKTKGPFRCDNCGNLFVKTFSDSATLCPDCR